MTPILLVGLVLAVTDTAQPGLTDKAAVAINWVLAILTSTGIGAAIVMIVKLRLERIASAERTAKAVQDQAELQAKADKLKTEAEVARLEKEKADRLAAALITKVEADTASLPKEARETKRGEFGAAARAFGAGDALEKTIERLGFKGSRTKPEIPVVVEEEGK